MASSAGTSSDPSLGPFGAFRPETRQRIDAARPAVRLAWIAGSLFSERGFDATSIRDIAAAAGVAPSSVYSHYSSKEALLVAYLNESHQAAASLLRTQLLENAARSPADQVAALITFAVERFLARPGASALSRAALRRVDRESTATARRMRAEADGLVGDIIRRGRVLGDLRSTEPADQLAAALLSTARQTAPWYGRWPVTSVPELAEHLGAFARRIVVSATRVDSVPVPRPAVRPGTSTRARIVDAAVTHFAHKGYLGASLRDIADTVGIRPPSIYEHFGSKGDLLAAVVETVVSSRVDAVHRAVAESHSDDPVDRVVAMLRSLSGTVVLDPDAAIAVDTDFDRLPEPVRAPLADQHRQIAITLAGLVRQGRAAGRFDYGEPTAVVVFAVLAVATQPAWLVVESPRLDLAGLVADSVSYALRILGVDR